MSALLTGTGVQEVVSTTTLSYVTSNGGLPLKATPLTLTATVTTASNAGTPSGSVVFMVDTRPRRRSRSRDRRLRWSRRWRRERMW